MCWLSRCERLIVLLVSVAGCLGYDVLVAPFVRHTNDRSVSVAGCLGYDVLVLSELSSNKMGCFSCWLFRL